jgi:4-hydroxy-tetrahydrodipicolinate synthase
MFCYIKMPMKQGSSCAIITPMTNEGKLDIPSLRKLLKFHLASETDNLCILGTTGEASVLNMEERAQVLTTAVEEVKGKIPILAGTGTIKPEAVREMTLQAIELGCDASLVVTPYYVKPPQRGLIKHFTDMADIGLPVVMYNIPGRSQVDLSVESTVICAQHPNIIGLKDATGDLDRVQQIRQSLAAEDDLLLYSGEDGTSSEFVMRGGDGCISVTANVAPKAIHDLMMASLAGNAELAKNINKPMLDLHKKLFVESNPIPVKYAAWRMGLISTPYCRPPLSNLDAKYYNDVETAMEAAGLFGFGDGTNVVVPSNAMSSSKQNRSFSP